MTRRVIAIASLLGTVFLLTGGAPTKPCPVKGRFVHAGGDKDLEGRDQAIEVAIEDMNFVFRPFARSRLKANTEIRPWLQFEEDGHHLTLTWHDGELKIPMDGTPVELVGKQGDPATARCRIEGDKIILEFINPQGGRETVFRRTKKGLVADVRIFADPLPEDIKYRLTYREDSPTTRTPRKEEAIAPGDPKHPKSRTAEAP